jgi:glycopeptide antibiotics resistance protein
MITRRIRPDLIYAIVWIVVILMMGILPLKNFVGHSHWEYIKWFPTAEDLHSSTYLLDIASDFVGNTLLFVPLGYFLSRLLAPAVPARQMLIAAAIGGALSLGIEFYQVYCHSRFPSIFDVITNVAGVLLGVRIGRSHAETRGMAGGRDRVFPADPQDHTLAP